MLAPLYRYPETLTLIPWSLIQFVDFGFNESALGKVERFFYEEPSSEPQAGPRAKHRLCFAERDPDAHDADPNSNEGFRDKREPRKSIQQEIYGLKAKEALDPILGIWLPLPFFREAKFGPTTWCRVRIVKLGKPDHDGHTHRITLAFDTHLEEQEKPYVAPTPKDVGVARFCLVTDEQDCSAFLNLKWVDQWLEIVYKNEKLISSRGHYCEHWARYLTLLQILARTSANHGVRFADTLSERERRKPVDVDLVLDVGNSRTCGILREYPQGAGQDSLNQSYRLILRDLSRPELICRDPFETRVEFAKAEFGFDDLTNDSGRSDAFQWPQIVRVGPEATRLSRSARGSEGSSGMSSPKRYLWDRDAREQEWRLASRSELDKRVDPIVDQGKPLEFLKDNGDLRGKNDFPGSRSVFSRSSMMMFALSEVILHALAQINSVANRCERENSFLPRRLSRILLTVPTAMPLEERRILERRARDAVKLTWASLGWTQLPTAESPPVVQLDWDEATCTQLVWLYTEIAQKFGGLSKPLLSTTGRVRPGHGSAPSLRIASIDIGGGTTDLIITTFEDEAWERSAAVSLRPKPNFREGFNVAGDDVLRAVIERHVVPVILAGMRQAGVPDPKALLTGLIGSDVGGLGVTQRVLRAQFSNQVLAQLGLAILSDYERADVKAADPRFARTFDDVFSAETLPSREVLAFLEDAVSRALDERGRAPATPFRLAELSYEGSLRAVHLTVKGVLQPILSDLCEVVNAYDCDWLLVSGRPSKLPAVFSCLCAKLPLPVSRIQLMHRYRVGTWYPFRDSYDRIDDPKTTAAVGALLCSLAKTQLGGFALAGGDLRPRSTARFIGAMTEGMRTIARSEVLFSNVDLDQDRAVTENVAYQMINPISIGFRQLDIERWPTTQLYRLEWGPAFRDPERAARFQPPLRVTLGRQEMRVEGEEELTKEALELRDDVEDRTGESLPRGAVVLRLQTLAKRTGYWLDTGEFRILEEAELR